MAIESAISSGYHFYKIGVRVEETSMMKAARAFMLLSKLEQLGDFVQMKPSAETLEMGELEESFALYFLSKEDRETLLEQVEDSSEIEEVIIKETTFEEEMMNDQAAEESEKPADGQSSEPVQADQKQTGRKKPQAAKQTIRGGLDASGSVHESGFGTGYPPDPTGRHDGEKQSDRTR
ncbi:MAG: hypothetical protein U5K84_10820 [Alkalibacterium sp.]|nr:hypothetical protein [Alkalibacterium sp.]